MSFDLGAALILIGLAAALGVSLWATARLRRRERRAARAVALVLGAALLVFALVFWFVGRLFGLSDALGGTERATAEAGSVLLAMVAMFGLWAAGVAAAVALAVVGLLGWVLWRRPAGNG